jgi:hypothetical protein
MTEGSERSLFFYFTSMPTQSYLILAQLNIVILPEKSAFITLKNNEPVIKLITDTSACPNYVSLIPVEWRVETN